MTNFPGGFPGQNPGGFPNPSPGNFTLPDPGRRGGGTSPPLWPRPMPGGRPNFPGGPSIPAPPPEQLINRFQYLRQNPTQAVNMLQPQGDFQTFAAGCDGRWTIIRLWNGQLFLMFVLSTNVFGNTTGIIWPNFTFGSFPSSQIAYYQCF